VREATAPCDICLKVKVKVKVKVWTLAIAPLTWVRLVTSSALQSRKWQLIGMSQWCCSALCGHPLPALTDNWTHGAASRHTIAPINHTRPSPRSRSYYSFPVSLRVGVELAWAHSRLASCSRLLAVDLVWIEPATSRLRVRLDHCTHYCRNFGIQYYANKKLISRWDQSINK